MFLVVLFMDFVGTKRVAFVVLLFSYCLDENDSNVAVVVF